MSMERPSSPHPKTAQVRACEIPLVAGRTPVAMAFIIGVEGPSYRPPGACMIVWDDGHRTGTLSSGCIDQDIAAHAEAVAETGKAKCLRYGLGSPFLDLVLPCGGGLDILVVPPPKAEHLQNILADVAARRSFFLWLGLEGVLNEPSASAKLALTVLPDPRFLVFGKGPEAVAFTAMAAGAGYDTVLASPDEETLQRAPSASRRVHLTGPSSFTSLDLDAQTAGVLFFHDHDMETVILQWLLASNAFYIGAQGSHRAAARRLERLRAAGLGEDALQRLHGPIGVIPSARDARTLAASVLAEILGLATTVQ
ncbi:XdhC family protein [Allorhizobium sp. BGMRC 0089]|uniref:XdhC family protein n=1 Tax=Allorhizobium sonneratiae TaxID=2934936 RepID=UPI002034357B|nr:XdhC family protein [Allorhizobium sonneratiae]MCM2293080.1 XdhC family protein [Allorhizobium sonneratiae]